MGSHPSRSVRNSPPPQGATAATKPIAEPRALAELPSQISHAELREHSTADDCWLVVHGKVVDVSTFAVTHPGGQALLTQYGGQDASEAFDAIGHSRNARRQIAQLQVGVLA